MSFSKVRVFLLREHTFLSEQCNVNKANRGTVNTTFFMYGSNRNLSQSTSKNKHLIERDLQQDSLSRLTTTILHSIYFPFFSMMNDYVNGKRKRNKQFSNDEKNEQKKGTQIVSFVIFVFRFHRLKSFPSSYKSFMIEAD